MTGAEWITVTQLITSTITVIAAPFVSYWMWKTKQGVDETKVTVAETKNKVEETKAQVDESLLRLDGRLTKLLEQTELRVRAETRVAVEEEARERAAKLKETNTIALEKQTKDKAVADALVLKTAEDKVYIEQMEQNLVTAEAEKAMLVAKREAEEAAKKCADDLAKEQAEQHKKE